MQWVGVDFVCSLPVTPRGYDMLCVFVCHLSSRIILVPCQSSLSAEEFAQLFFNHVYRNWGAPEALISDRDGRFTSAYWETAARRLGVALRMSTAYHPQSDGKTERVNRVVEDMLRSYVCPAQTDWDEWLTAVEFAYNNSVQASSGYTPFYLSTGQEPRTPLALMQPDLDRRGARCPGALERIHEWQQAVAHARRCLAEAKHRQKEYYDRNRSPLPLQPGDVVLLSTENLRHPNGSRPKLAPRRIGPFKVLRTIGPTAAELDLSTAPRATRLHPVFHVSLLERYVPGPAIAAAAAGAPAPAPPTTLSDAQLEMIDEALSRRELGVFQAVKLTGHLPRATRDRAEVTHYTVRWDGYSPAHDSDEPAARVAADMPEFVDQYWAHRAELDQRAVERAARPPPAPLPPEEPTRVSTRVRKPVTFFDPSPVRR
jgi:hypothetical protein